MTFVSYNHTSSVYIAAGEFSNPSQFEYDIKYENVQANRSITINGGTSLDDFGYSVGIKIHGFDYDKGVGLSNIVYVESNA